MGSLPIEALSLEKMASGHSCLNLSERISWEHFGAYAERLLRTLGGLKISVADSVEMRVWTVSIDGRVLSLVFSDYPAMVSLESSDDEGDKVLDDVRAKLLKGLRSTH
ncbi:MAG: DUF3630 family protein [Myxococcaceae bacterium]